MLRLLALVFAAPFFTFAFAEVDADRDGLDDEMEQRLLKQFAPVFYIHAQDCDSRPSEFTPRMSAPVPSGRNTTLYGQVFPSGGTGAVEIHYYHLWSRDCGRRMQHDLDAESVSLLVRLRGDRWEAAYWYAAAHENTLCDMSHARKAPHVRRGADIWISKDKHASFLDRELCTKGCGNDDCSGAVRLAPAKLINVGEPNAPMNGATWTGSDAWPLASKMQPDFTPEFLARMPEHDRAELLPAREPALGVRSTIKVAGTAYGALETANDHATGAVGSGVGRAVKSSGSALKRAGRWIKGR